MLFQEVISEQKSISKILEWHYLCIFFSPLQDPICRCPEYLWVQKSIIQPGYLIQGMSSCQKAFYIRALCWKFCFGNEFWNRKSWNENKEQKRICKIIRRLKKKKKATTQRFWLTGSPFSASLGLTALEPFFCNCVWSLDFILVSPSLFLSDCPDLQEPGETDILIVLWRWTEQNEVLLLCPGLGRPGHRTTGKLLFFDRQISEVPRTDAAGTEEHPAQHHSCADRWSGCRAGWDPGASTCQSLLLSWCAGFASFVTVSEHSRVWHWMVVP